MFLSLAPVANFLHRLKDAPVETPLMNVAIPHGIALAGQCRGCE